MDDMTVERWQDPEAPGRHGVTLTGSMTIGQAAELKEILAAVLGEASEVVVDVSGVTEIDLTGLQLLGASHRSALARDKRLVVKDGANQVYQAAVASAGFQRRVGCPFDKNGTCLWVGGEN
jgi:anti-anti-sigma regulatory factor